MANKIDNLILSNGGKGVFLSPHVDESFAVKTDLQLTDWGARLRAEGNGASDYSLEVAARNAMVSRLGCTACTEKPIFTGKSDMGPAVLNLTTKMGDSTDTESTVVSFSCIARVKQRYGRNCR